MGAESVIGTVALMLGAGLACQIAADWARIPAMLVLVATGVALGPSGAGLVDVPLDSTGAELVLTIGVCFILFHGGLQLSARVLGSVALGLGALVIPGVVVTAAITGAVAAAVFGLPIETGLLVGAVLAPTDPAILIPLFERLRVRRRVSQTIIAESALNDPTGAVLALGLAGVVAGGSFSFGGTVGEFAGDLVLSTILGAGAGVLLALTVCSHRPGIWRESSPLACLTVVAATAFGLDAAGGSGYLGAFVAGLIVANMDGLRLAMHGEHERELRAFVHNLSSISVMFVFLILGASLPLHAMGEHLLGGLAVVAALVLVARPLTVLVCLVPDRRARWTPRELVFLAATRETGVMPAALASIVAGMGVAAADLIMVCVALTVLVTLGLQATLKPWLALRLGLIEVPVAVEPTPAPGVVVSAAEPEVLA